MKAGPASSEPVLRDVVEAWSDADDLPAPPLIVLEGLRREIGAERELELERIGAGHSNATFWVRCGGRKWVLRRPPRPPFAPSAHDVEREYRVLAALQKSGVRVPAPVSMHTDAAAIGAPFYLMECVEGQIIRSKSSPPLASPAQRRRAGEEMVVALHELHAVDWRSCGLESPGKANGYLDRQLRLWGRQWDRNRTREMPLIDRLGRDLRRAMPSSESETVVHGDYKLDNVVFENADPTRLKAILDWEMSTVGDPLADVGYLTATWLERGEDDRLLGLTTATREVGFPTRSELADRYATLSGRDLEQLSWYQGLALWKLAVLLEGSYARFLSGTADDPFFARLEAGVPDLAELGRRAIAGELT